jgi:hypothetical protein
VGKPFAVTATAPTTPTGEPAVLSPFVMGAEQDTGYRATATLQGRRSRINLADLATWVCVFTKDFMEDLAVNNVEQAYVFSTDSPNRRAGIGSRCGWGFQRSSTRFRSQRRAAGRPRAAPVRE